MDIYKYIEIKTKNLNNDNFDGEVKIGFSVERNWIESNNLGRADVALYRFADEKWNQLPTNFVDERGDIFLYSATTPGFSYFAIGKKS